jgi:negative regulator of sigma E activity
MWKWDQTIAKRTLQENFKGTVKMGAVAAVTFAAVSWVSKVTAKSPTGEQAQQTHRMR